MARNPRSWWHRWLNGLTPALRHKPRRQRPFLEMLEDRCLLSTYTVTNANDSGPGSLRDAINQVNAGTYNEIDFAGSYSITPQSPLPAVTASNVFINGGSGGTTATSTSTSHTTYGGVNTNFYYYSFFPTLNGANAGAGSDGLYVTGSDCTVSGLVIAGFSGKGVEVAGGKDVVSGNQLYSNNIGLALDSAATGTLVQYNVIGLNDYPSSQYDPTAAPNVQGIEVFGPNNTISGNDIDGNSQDGILIEPALTASGNLVQGNTLGGDQYQGRVFGNHFNGITVATSNNTISGNTIADNGINGVGIELGVSGVSVQGNSIGIIGAGTSALGNTDYGVFDAGSNNTIGGTTAAARNVISGNGAGGVAIGTTSGSANVVSNNLVQGNYIGTNASGTGAVGNHGDGIYVVGAGVVGTEIGGTASGAGNVISGNAKDGVLIDSGVSGIAVQGDFIGTNAAGTAALGNGNVGVEIDSEAGSITVGGTTSAARNVISGNTYGIETTYLLSTGVTVQGNYIGTNAAGNAAVGNVDYGIWCFGSNDTIGGTLAGARNVISGNGTDGILLDGIAFNDAVEGNYIGTNAAGTAAVGNGTGIHIGSEDGGNTVGGTITADRNIISGNSKDGILLTSSGETVEGNFIGLNVSGNSAVGNSVGVEIAGSNNTIGGTSYYARNHISANSGDGVLIDSGVSGNQVLGNFVGIDFSGKLNVGNGASGIEVAGTSNTLGGTASGARNVVAANGTDGVLLDSSASGNVVQGNYLGTDFSGGKALGNKNGVEIDNASNTIGGTASAARNVISGNSGDGVLIDSGVSGMALQGNYIGLDENGNAVVGNRVGVEVAGSNDTIGGATAAARNIISGNSNDGVLLDSSGSGNVVLGNFVGLDLSGGKALGNQIGVEVQGSNNTVGGTSYYARNYISGNSKDGVLLDSTASANQVLGNFVGLNFTGKLKLGNSANGIEVAGSNNTLGGTAAGARNVISGNGNDGVLIDSTASGTQVQGNYLGTDLSGKAAAANGAYGVSIASSHNTVGGNVAVAANTIAFNGQGGVLVSAGKGDTIRRNSLFANGGTQTGPGITLASGSNNNVVAPLLSTATYNGTTLMVTGTFTAPIANFTYVLEFFANPSGDAEGKVYLGSLAAKPATTGTQPFTFTVTTSVPGTDPLITATLTDANSDTSVFSNGVTS
jgi:parallel beta-helix repeat protein